VSCVAPGGKKRYCRHYLIGLVQLHCFYLHIDTKKKSRTDGVQSEVLRNVNDERNIVNTVKRRKANRIGKILRSNCVLKRVLKER